MNKMQQQAPQTMSSAQSTPLNLVSTEQIQKYLEENKNLILAILENQNLGKLAECAQYQAILQKNLMYLAAIADAQPPASTTPSQAAGDAVAPQANTSTSQTQAPMMQQQATMAKLPFQLNAAMPPEQRNQLLHFQQLQQQQQLQAQYRGSNNNMHILMQPGLNNSGMQASSGNGQGNSGMGPMEGRER